MRGELDWIVMKSLEKDSTRRYESASSLAKDVERYLCNEPVSAATPSTAYRLRTFVRRNRPQVVAAGLVLLALVAGIVGTTLGLLHADSKRWEAEQARSNEATQRGIAEGQTRLALASANEERKAKIAEKDIMLQAEIRQLVQRRPPHEAATTAHELQEKFQEAKKALQQELEEKIAAVRTRA